MPVRTTLLQAMCRLGLLRLWQYANRGKIPILTFHGIGPADEDADCSPLRGRLSSRDLGRYMQVLSECFTFVSLDVAVEMLSGGQERRPHCLVLTLDDGYLNNATIAWPVLREYGVPATFFVPTGYIGTAGAFWADRLDHAIRHLRPAQEFVTVGGIRYPIVGRARRDQVRLFWALKGACEGMGDGQAEQAVTTIEDLAASRLADSTGNDRWAAFMSWQHVRSMRKEGADFGSHTVRHRLLDRLPSDEVQAELRPSRAELERQTQATCRSIAYPHGRYTQEVAAMAREAGYCVAVTTVEGPASASAPLMALPRIGLPSSPLTDRDLLARATGLSVALSRTRKLLALTGRRNSESISGRHRRVHRVLQ